jgi:hypothetical protein
MGKVSSHVALQAVREPLGPCTWVLFGPSEAGKELQFINAGSLSINGALRALARARSATRPRPPHSPAPAAPPPRRPAECVKWLKDDENYYGLLRMGFGEGRFRRTKWCGILRRAQPSHFSRSHLPSLLLPPHSLCGAGSFSPFLAPRSAS